MNPTISVTVKQKSLPNGREPINRNEAEIRQAQQNQDSINNMAHRRFQSPYSQPMGAPPVYSTPIGLGLPQLPPSQQPFPNSNPTATTVTVTTIDLNGNQHSKLVSITNLNNAPPQVGAKPYGLANQAAYRGTPPSGF
jgi:hypothetical protein